MPAYFLVDTREVKDAAKLQQYGARVTSVIERGLAAALSRGPECLAVDLLLKSERQPWRTEPLKGKEDSCQTKNCTHYGSI